MSYWELSRFAPASITHKRTAWWNDLIVRWKQWFESSFTKTPKIGTNGWNPFCLLCGRSRKPPRGFPPSSSCMGASPAGSWTSWGRLGRRDLQRAKMKFSMCWTWEQSSTPWGSSPWRICYRPRTSKAGYTIGGPDYASLHREMEVIEESHSDWASPIVLVPKTDGSVRFCVDYRKVNAVSKFDAYPMPRVDELLNRLGTARFYSTLDLTKGYWQIPLSPLSKEKSAFTTPFGLHQFITLPFGLFGAPATFQRLMDKILRPHTAYAAAYLDDIIIYSQDWQRHMVHLREVLRALRGAGLTANPRKCAIGRVEVRYLGFHLGHGQVRPQIDKTAAIAACPRPKTKKEVRQFLGLAGYYRRFIPDYSELTSPLTDLTKKEVPDTVPWTERCQQAFTQVKAALCGGPLLHSPDFSLPFLLQTDASDRGLGAVLTQEIRGEERPVLYISRKLSKRETMYSTIEKECLAIRWAVLTLRYYLLGREFTLCSDHAPLQWLHRMKDTNARITRWYLALQPFKWRWSTGRGRRWL